MRQEGFQANVVTVQAIVTPAPVVDEEAGIVDSISSVRTIHLGLTKAKEGS